MIIIFGLNYVILSKILLFTVSTAKCYVYAIFDDIFLMFLEEFYSIMQVHNSKINIIISDNNIYFKL